MQKKTMKVNVVFTEPVLGSCSGNPEIHEEFIASRVTQDKGTRKEQADKLRAEEVAVSKEQLAGEIEEQVGKQTTVFARDDKGLFLWDYSVRGFVKESLRTLIDLGDCKLSRWSYKRVVDSTLFVFPRRIYLRVPGKDEVWQKAEKHLQRPLRAETMRGERIALANSEQLPEGTWFECDLHLMLPEKGSKSKDYMLDPDVLEQVLDYGAYKGIGQWRGGGFGKFEWSEVK